MIDKKEEEINPANMLRVVRIKYPNMIRNELCEIHPIEPTKYKKPVLEIRINGGLTSNGFIPYTLDVCSVMYQDIPFALYFLSIVKNLQTLDSAEDKKDFEIKKPLWIEICKNFNSFFKDEELLSLDKI